MCSNVIETPTGEPTLKLVVINELKNDGNLQDVETLLAKLYAKYDEVFDGEHTAEAQQLSWFDAFVDEWLNAENRRESEANRRVAEWLKNERAHEEQDMAEGRFDSTKRHLESEENNSTLLVYLMDLLISAINKAKAAGAQVAPWP